MSRLARSLALAATLAVAFSACSSSAPAGQPSASPAPADPSAAGKAPAGKTTVIPVIVSQQQVVGPNRFVFSFIDAATNLPAAKPERSASVAFIAPGETNPGTAVPGTFVWAIEGSRGTYVARVDFASAGDWKAIFVTGVPGKPQEAIGVGFQVVAKGTTVAVGQPAPASKTPTANDVAGDLRRISTDPNPDPAFYRLSVADAIARHTPFVLIFATPAFCQSAQCGPTLDRVKAVAKTAPPSVAFINVEPYVMTWTEGRLQPVLDPNGGLQPIEPVNEWGLLTEPWIFTVDRNGIVRGSFEGVVGDGELKDAIAAIAGA